MVNVMGGTYRATVPEQLIYSGGKKHYVLTTTLYSHWNKGEFSQKSSNLLLYVFTKMAIKFNAETVEE
jgi:hypothetical protein